VEPSVPERDIILSYPILSYPSLVCYSILFYLSNSTSMINFKIPFSTRRSRPFHDPASWLPIDDVNSTCLILVRMSGHGALRAEN
jgi:hypothetical protein